MHSISLWDAILLLFYSAKKGIKWSRDDFSLMGPFFLSLFMCAIKIEGDYENRAEHKDIENREPNKMRLQVNKAELAVYVYLAEAPNIRGP
jgi:hypothetical protein